MTTPPQQVDRFLRADVVVGFVVGTPRPPEVVNRRRRPAAAPAPPRSAEAAVWAHHADELAAAAVSMLNRRDACGGYRGGRPTTRKATDTDWIEIGQALRLHFAGERCIGLHSTAPPPEGVCRWLAFDLDAHGEDADPDANLQAAEETINALLEIMR